SAFTENGCLCDSRTSEGAHFRSTTSSNPIARASAANASNVGRFIGLSPSHLELDIDVVACRVRVRADLFVRFLRQCRELCLRQRLVFDAHLHRNSEAAAVARSDRNCTGDHALRRILLLRLRDEVKRATETGSITRREKMLWGRRVRLPRSAHRLGNGK